MRVAAADINPIDLLEQSGSIHDYRPVAFPGILGWDLSGTVEKLGSDVHTLAVGDLVVEWAYQTYASLCAIQAKLLVKIPVGLDLVSAAALPLVSMRWVGSAVPPCMLPRRAAPGLSPASNRGRSRRHELLVLTMSSP